MKKILSVLLVLSMLLGLGATALAADAELPISQGTYPIVPEGEKVTINVGIVRHATYGGDPENLWLWNYLAQLTGIDFEFTTVIDSAVTERKNLMFASDTLPDVLIGFGLTTAELVTYGQVDGQLQALNDYINEENMPNLMQWIAARPEIISTITCPDGKIYTLPLINANPGKADSPSLPAMYINQEWLTANNKEWPATIDELTALMKEWKAANPDLYPFAACAKPGPSGMGLLLNALGFLSGKNDTYGKEITLRNGEVVIPCYDPLFKEYLEVVKSWFDEGLVSPDFFTMDQPATFAMVGENKSLIFCGQPYLANSAYESFSRWSAITPLTSEHNETPIVPMTLSTIGVGGFVVKAGAENMDVIMKMADWFYSALGGFYQWYGPETGSELAIGMENVRGWVVDENGVGSFTAVNEGTMPSNAAYILGNIQSNWVAFGNNSHWLGREDELLTGMGLIRQYLGGFQPVESVLDPTIGIQNAAITAGEYVFPYVQYAYPKVVYMSEDAVLAIADLNAVLSNYIDQEVAKFITGRRSLDEFDAFRAELKGMGIEELLGYYQDAYKTYAK